MDSASPPEEGVELVRFEPEAATEAVRRHLTALDRGVERLSGREAEVERRLVLRPAQPAVEPDQPAAGLAVVVVHFEQMPSIGQVRAALDRNFPGGGENVIVQTYGAKESQQIMIRAAQTGRESGADLGRTADDLARLVRDGELRYIYWNAGGRGMGTNSEISAWVADSCSPVQGFDTSTQNAGAPV